jgi:hypothetical protein
VHEGGSGRDARFDANAWYVEVQYSLAVLPWSSTLSYRFARFSGDPNLDDDRRQDFDPFFYGWSRGWGTWFQGEVTGEYLLFNSNQANHMVHLSASPNDSLAVGAILYRFNLAEPSYFGTPVSDTAFTAELNLYLDWSLNDNVALSLIYGIAFPRAAAEEAFGDDEPFEIIELALYLTF